MANEIATVQQVISGERQWTVLHGDCAELLSSIGPVDALITDPPYGIGEAAGKNKSRGNLAKAKDYGDDEWDNAPPDATVIDLARSIARTQVIFGGNYFVLPPTKCWLVWDKLNGSNDFADCELAWTNLNIAVRRLAYRWNGMLRENNETRGLHPTQKPIGLMQWVLGLATKEGDVVVDPFCGSGTTGAACVRMGRRFIGIEREQKYFETSVARLAAESDGLSLEEARAGQTSLFGGAA